MEGDTIDATEYAAHCPQGETIEKGILAGHYWCYFPGTYHGLTIYKCSQDSTKFIQDLSLTIAR